MATEWPLVGRSSELDQVRGLLRAGERGVVLAGAAGVGKTRLGRECLTLAAGAGYATAWVGATRAASAVPFGAFAPLLPPFDVDTVGRQGQAELLRRTARALVDRVGERLALFVDDAHLLDEVSATLTYQLATTVGVFVVVTVRLGEPSPDAIVALWKDGVTERLDVAPLSPPDVEALLAAALGGPVDGATAHYLVSRSGGNVQYLRELVLAALDVGTLRADDGVWRLVDHSLASARLVELVEARLGRLSERERAVLEVLAYGEPVGLRALRELADEESLEALERRGLLAVTRSGRRTEIRLAHPLHGDVVRFGVGALRAEAIRTALAEAVEHTGARRKEDLLQVATWRLETGQTGDAQLMLAAARRAAALQDLDLAERLGRAACEAGAGFEGALLMAQVTGMAGRWDEAERALVELAARASDDAQRAQVTLNRIDSLALGRSRRSEAIRVAEEAEGMVTDRVFREAIRSRRASLLFCDGRTAEAIALVEPVIADGEGPSLVLASVLGAVALALQGRIDKAVAAADRGLSAHATLDEASLLWEHHAMVMNRAHALAYAGRLDEAEAAARRAYDRAVVSGRPSVYAWVLARVALTRGRAGTAVRLAREAASLGRGRGFPRTLRWVLADLAHALALAGQAEEAAATVAELDAMDVECDAPYQGHELQARAWAAVAAGDEGRARDLLEKAAEVGAAIGTRFTEALALHDLARLGLGADVADRLRVLAADIDGTLAPAWAAHAAALAVHDPDALEEVSDDFEAIGAMLLAAEAAAAAAVVRRESGRPRQAAADERRAAELARRCEGAMTPRLRNVQTQSLLSTRELEVASLAAAGLANKQIADRLYLSVRTVESQLQRAYEKLGIRRRSDLGEALQPGWDDRANQ